MKLVILAGGQRSTITGNEENIPKPMIDIGGRPLLWHIMKHASLCGINDFIICGGYKIENIKEYFRDFYIYQSDIAVNTKTNRIELLKDYSEDWNVIVADTGVASYPIERVKKVLKYVGDEPFLITYGDCLTDLPFDKFMLDFVSSKTDFAVALAHPLGRKMPISYNLLGDSKKHENDVWTSAGIFASNKRFFAQLNCDGVIEDILRDKRESDVHLYKHESYWNTIETLRDKVASEQMWEKGEAPWI